MRFHRPRELGTTETADTLDHWISQFTVYIQRDPIMSPFLTGNWDPNHNTMGFTEAREGVSAVQQSANCKLFLSHLASFMTVPYHKKSIEKRTNNIESVWNLLRGIYNVEKSAETLLDIGSLTYNKAESFASFYYKIVYYIEMNLAPANIEVNYINSGEDGDNLSVTLLDMAALLWLTKIDHRLYDKIKINYAVQIKNGERLSQLVPTIAKALPGMIKNMDSVKKEVVHLISEMNLGPNEDDYQGETSTQIFKVNNQRPPRSNNSNRGGARPNSFNRGGARTLASPRKPVCTHCNWLKTHLNIKEIDIYHPTTSCSRALPHQVKSIIEQGSQDEDQFEDTEDDIKDGGDYDNMDEPDPHITLFQKIYETTSRVQPPNSKAQDGRKSTMHDPIKSKACPLSESALKSLKIRALRLNRKAKSPKILVTISGDKVPLHIDEGSELNCMDSDFAKKKEIRLAPSSRTATAAGNSNLIVLGESEKDVVVDTLFQSRHVSINLGRVTVIKDLGAAMILGEPGKSSNGLSTDPKNRVVFMEDEGRFLSKPYYEDAEKKIEVCRITSGSSTVFPGDHINVEVPESFQGTPSLITPRKEYSEFFPQKFTTPGEIISLHNTSEFPITLKKHSHVADIRHTEEVIPASTNNVHLVHEHTSDNFKFEPRAKEIAAPDVSLIKIDPDGLLSPETRSKFVEINKKYQHIFTTTPTRYSGAFGDTDTSLNFTSKPVQTRKVTQPSYSQEMKETLAQMMDELYQQGVLCKPEEIGISLEFMSPSLIVPKPGGGWRLVTDFTELNKYIRPYPSASPSISEAKRDLAQKKFFCELDLSNYFHQGGIRREDCSWLGVMHPFLGPMCYTTSPQGLRNSSEFSYDRLARVFGEMIRQKRLTRMADGLFVLGDTEKELLTNYLETIERCSQANLSLKPAKCSIAPKSAVIFGWKIESGEWTPQEHVVSSLCRAELPTTVKQLRSFNGAVKQLSEAVPQYAVLLHPLEKIIGARGSAEKITWNDELKEAFQKVKDAIKKPDGIYVPRSTDRLETSSDFSKSQGAVGGMMTILRKDSSGKEIKLLGGHFSAKLNKGRSLWLPCDGEALACKLVLEHFQNEIRESRHEVIHYTDSMPVVMAARKLVTGRFSTSAKITTFLSTIATLPVRIEHRPGSSMKLSDHASRNPPPICESDCQICKYVQDETDVGNQLSIFKLDEGDDCEEIFKEPDSVPFLQLKTWLHEQRNCPIHGKLMKLIKTGQTPERRKTGGANTTLKHLHTLYTRDNLKVHKSGVIMVRCRDGYFDGYAISVPEPLFHGLAFQMHHRLQHPKKSQLVKFLSRYFFVTALPNVVDQVSNACLQCLSTTRLPKALLPQTTTIPSGFGTSFSCDVLERAGQVIFVCKEEMSQFTSTSLADDQTTGNMRDALIQAVAPLINVQGAKIRLDAAPAFQSLASKQDNDPVLKQLNIVIEIGHSLNKNHNPQAENCVAEIKRELLNLSNKNQPISKATLAIATRNLNYRIRSSGKSAWEFLTSRDKMTSRPFEHDDKKTITELTNRREAQHQRSEKFQAKSKSIIQHVDYSQGDLVMYRDIENYDAGRDTFLVVADHGQEIEIRKFKDQIRMKTYRVKREQIILVFSPKSLTQGETATTPSTLLTPPSSSKKPIRQAALKSRLQTAELSAKKLLAISEKERKTKKKEISDDSPNWVYLFTQVEDQQVPVNLDDNDDEDDDDAFFNNDDDGNDRGYENDDINNEAVQHVENDDHDDNALIFPFHLYDAMLQDPVNQNPDLETPGGSPPESDTTSSESGQPNPPSIMTMSPLSRLSLERHFSSTESSASNGIELDWDHNSMTVNLSDPLDRSKLFSLSSLASESDNDNVFDPVLFIPPSPPSPFLRVTRSLLREGTFARTSEMEPFVSVSTSGPESPFLRENQLRRPLRRPIQRVNFALASAEIADITSATADNSRQVRRRRLESIRESSSD